MKYYLYNSLANNGIKPEVKEGVELVDAVGIDYPEYLSKLAPEDEVVLVGGEKTVVGTPVVEGASVVGTVEKQGKQKKVVTFKYKPKKGSHRKQGHRQPYTKVVINAINA